jgi:hypothetical protein
MVEYQSADAIPTVLEKDRRRFDGAEIHVSMLWRSTLFVTNFPPTADDAALRTLFSQVCRISNVALQDAEQLTGSQYGTILQTRWPSRKYADSRRFCYITMEAPVSFLLSCALVLRVFDLHTKDRSRNSGCANACVGACACAYQFRQRHRKRSCCTSSRWTAARSP